VTMPFGVEAMLLSTHIRHGTGRITTWVFVTDMSKG